ncbi:stage V sporulation protein B [Paenibacillus sp. yr247]|uniref:oligosaccharide flippase family protein n=1 Tax=Paenibacillus sp. yr247 TaxID=1761880 RepID=UPI00088EE1E6|nr:oligosaccharide flippase family protein [Paenibacillus sp. yr247]SDP10120.1 stage V sporulation protein B [Paenibacillus sp. yr247]
MRLPELATQMALRTGAIFLVKVLGFFARIMLFRLLGSEGIGLYQMAYSVYALILTFIIGGFPTAISLSTARDRKQGWQLFKGSAIFLALSGVVLGFYCFGLATPISLLLGDAHLEFALQCIAPAIAIVPFLSFLRGFLQGMEYYGLIAVSEIIEQLFRIAVMIIITTAWLRFGIPNAVGGSMLGAPAGAFIALCFLLIVLVSSTNHKLNFNNKKTTSQRLKKPSIFLFIFTSLSILATRLIVPVSDFLDAIIIPHQLQAAGMSVSDAISVYGIITGMATTIVYMPTLVIFALAYTLSTKITTDWQAGRQDRFVRRIRSAMEIAWLWGCGSALVLFFYANDLSNLLFSNGLAETGIRYMSLVPLLSGIRELSTIALWGIGDKKTPLIGLIIGVICSLTLNYYLIAIPGFTYAGAAIGILSLELIAALWNMNTLRTYTKGILKGLTSSTIVIILFFAVSLFLAKLTFQVIHLPRQSIVEMMLIYGCLIFYILMRFLKNERRLIL